MSFLEIIKHMRIEPFIFLFMFAMSLQGLSITQLAQDKICRFKYGLSAEYCEDLSSEVDSNSANDYKNQILSDVTSFTLYKTLINSIPVIFWSLFLGAWADRHSRAPKFLMSVVSIMTVIESVVLLFNAFYFNLDENYIILAFIPSSLCGGMLSVMMSVYAYISATTEPQFRTIKFAILEALIFVAAPMGIYIGGSIIGTNILGPNGQLHRYVEVFSLGIFAQLLATLWIVFIPFEKSIFKKDNKINSDRNGNECLAMDGSVGDSNIDIAEEEITSNEERKPLIPKPVIGSTNKDIQNVEKVLNLSLTQQMSSETIDTIESPIEIHYTTIEGNESVKPVVMPEYEVEDVHWYVMFKDLFDIQNVKDMWKTCSKQRSGGKRAEIWILILSLTVISLQNNGSLGILFQFVQKVFQWNAETYSIVNASTLLITSVSVVVIVPVLIKGFKCTDMTLSIIGILSIILQNLIRGTLLNAEAFYVSYIFGSLAYVPAISVRSQIAASVDQSEENKVFGLLATFETITPFFSSIIYTTIFSATIAVHPGIVFLISTALLILPFIGFVYIALYCQ